MNSFLDRYEGAVTIKLEQNYRSIQNILSVRACNLIKVANLIVSDDFDAS
jgi:superfamily I DNA/RNA helicase